MCLKQLLQIVNSVQMQCSFVNFSLQTKVTYNCCADEEAGKYFGLCTRYACSKIMQSIEKSKDAKLEVSKKTAMHLNTAGNGEYTVKNCLQCTCLYFASELLPCKHIFAVHAFEGLSVFDVYSAELSVVTGTVR